MHKFASLLLSVAKMHWNAYCFICFGGLECFVCNRCTNLSHCCFQWHKCTGEMPTAPGWLWWPRALCLQQMHKSASLLLSVAQMHWITYCSTGLGGLERLSFKSSCWLNVPEWTWCTNPVWPHSVLFSVAQMHCNAYTVPQALVAYRVHDQLHLS